MANFVYIATSLDGYIAGPDGELDWLMNFPNPGKSDFGFGRFMKKIDALVMGRHTFEKVLTFGTWPYPKPVFVLSSTLTGIPEHLEGKVELVSGDLRAIVNDLNDRWFKNLYIDGGQTVQSFMREDLVDELILSRIPVVLGAGLPLFGKLDEAKRFDLVKNEAFKNGIVKTHYRRSR
ncbi:dihydrofolate reductase family protein [Pontiella agarivorans]|uniref:Dihydrofolate reductase family protein n=1 Tax=Pontiella agarivorans TaxID=3038953 RepID=A0ABU5MX05_9BACT|nr:dihydrofolate reductase family protein [Pontiella agarivorans]MDZ8118682.1 dihydrofolate reductase family protein [Pontiella agarivorans]